MGAFVRSLGRAAWATGDGRVAPRPLPHPRHTVHAHRQVTVAIALVPAAQAVARIVAVFEGVLGTCPTIRRVVGLTPLHGIHAIGASLVVASSKRIEVIENRAVISGPVLLWGVSLGCGFGLIVQLQQAVKALSRASEDDAGPDVPAEVRHQARLLNIGSGDVAHFLDQRRAKWWL